MCIVFHLTLSLSIYIYVHIQTALLMELASQHVCNAEVNQPYSLGGLNLQLFTITTLRLGINLAY